MHSVDTRVVQQLEFAVQGTTSTTGPDWIDSGKNDQAWPRGPCLICDDMNSMPRPRMRG